VIGMNERLLAKDPPGWSAKELLDELLTRTVRIVALLAAGVDGNGNRCEEKPQRFRPNGVAPRRRLSRAHVRHDAPGPEHDSS
jgi:hypothetical protein